jgi:hypothetical protein
MVVMRSKTRFGFGLGVSSSSPSAAKASCNSRLTTVGAYGPTSPRKSQARSETQNPRSGFAVI